MANEVILVDKKTVLELILNQERIEILRIDYFKSISFPQS